MRFYNRQHRHYCGIDLHEGAAAGAPGGRAAAARAGSDRRRGASGSAVRAHDLIEIEVHVLHAKFECIVQPKPCAVEERDDNPGHASQCIQKPPYLVAAQDHRQTHRRTGTRHLLDRSDVVLQHLAIQKEQRAERLVLRRRTDPLTDGQPLQKRRASWARNAVTGEMLRVGRRPPE
jgi:hypothetical protein